MFFPNHKTIVKISLLKKVKYIHINHNHQSNPKDYLFCLEKNRVIYYLKHILKFLIILIKNHIKKVILQIFYQF